MRPVPSTTGHTTERFIVDTVGMHCLTATPSMIQVRAGHPFGDPAEKGPSSISTNSMDGSNVNVRSVERARDERRGCFVVSILCGEVTRCFLVLSRLVTHSHLGHVFLDGPRPDTVEPELLASSPASDPRGKSTKYLPRFCINGAAMDFQER